MILEEGDGANSWGSHRMLSVTGISTFHLPPTTTHHSWSVPPYMLGIHSTEVDVSLLSLLFDERSLG